MDHIDVVAVMFFFCFRAEHSGLRGAKMLVLGCWGVGLLAWYHHYCRTCGWKKLKPTMPMVVRSTSRPRIATGDVAFCAPRVTRYYHIAIVLDALLR